MSDKSANFLTAGQLVTFTSGEYSDYAMHGTYVALETVSFEEANALVDRIKEELLAVHDAHQVFQASLLKSGYLMEVHNTERHIGEYDRLDIGRG